MFLGDTISDMTESDQDKSNLRHLQLFVEQFYKEIKQQLFIPSQSKKKNTRKDDTHYQV